MTPDPPDPEPERMLFAYTDSDSGDSVERMWVRALGRSEYVLDNIPFYVRGLAVDDVVLGTIEDDVLIYRSLARQSGHSTFRVIVLLAEQKEPVCAALHGFGCEVERFSQSNQSTLLAVVIPQTVNCLPLSEYLYYKHMSCVIEYEEASVSAVHLAQRNLPGPKT